MACPLAVVPLWALDQEEEVGKLRFPEIHFVWCFQKIATTPHSYTKKMEVVSKSRIEPLLVEFKKAQALMFITHVFSKSEPPNSFAWVFGPFLVDLWKMFHLGISLFSFTYVGRYVFFL